MQSESSTPSRCFLRPPTRRKQLVEKAEDKDGHWHVTYCPCPTSKFECVVQAFRPWMLFITGVQNDRSLRCSARCERQRQYRKQRSPSEHAT